MDKIRIKIDSDYLEDTDEIRKLTLQLKVEIEKLAIEDVELKKMEQEGEENSKGTAIEWGNLVIPLILSPAVTIALITSIHVWIKAKATTTIAKNVSIDLKNKKFVLKGYSDEEVTNIVKQLKEMNDG